MKKEHCDVFIILGAVWLIVGYLIYGNTSLWAIGFLFLLIGFICRIVKKK